MTRNLSRSGTHCMAALAHSRLQSGVGGIGNSHSKAVAAAQGRGHVVQSIRAAELNIFKSEMGNEMAKATH